MMMNKKISTTAIIQILSSRKSRFQNLISHKLYKIEQTIHHRIKQCSQFEKPCLLVPFNACNSTVVRLHENGEVTGVF